MPRKQLICRVSEQPDTGSWVGVGVLTDARRPPDQRLEWFKLNRSRLPHFCHREVREARRGDPAGLLRRSAPRNDTIRHTFVEVPFAR